MSLDIPEDKSLVENEASQLEELYAEYKQSGQNYDLLLEIAELHAKITDTLQRNLEAKRKSNFIDMAYEGDRLADRRRNRKYRNIL